MWISLPSTCCHSLLEPEDSTWDSDWRCRALASSVLSRSKPTLAKFWLRGWKREPWIRRLFGRIYEPSQANRGVESWISSLRATRASPSAWPGSREGLTIHGTSGRTSHESSVSANPVSCSSRTLPTTSTSDSRRSEPSYKEWATGLKQDFSRRLKSALRTEGRDSSLWPTTTTMDSIGSGAAGYGPVSSTGRPRAQGVTLTDAAVRGFVDANTQRVPMWATPRASPNENRGTRDYGRKGGKNLSEQAAVWATPTARDWKDGACAESEAPTSALLGRQVLRTPWGGSSTSQTGRVLNPRFVEALMGWPVGWTVSGSRETELSLTRLLTHS